MCFACNLKNYSINRLSQPLFCAINRCTFILTYVCSLLTGLHWRGQLVTGSFTKVCRLIRANTKKHVFINVQACTVHQIATIINCMTLYFSVRMVDCAPTINVAWMEATELSETCIFSKWKSGYCDMHWTGKMRFIHFVDVVRSKNNVGLCFSCRMNDAFWHSHLFLSVGCGSFLLKFASFSFPLILHCCNHSFALLKMSNVN